MKLTDEQIAELAPDWATHYYYHLRYIAFASEKLFCKYDLDIGVFSKQSNMVCKISDLGGIEIKRKPFDISEYEFSDTAKDCGVEFRVPAWVYPDIEINVKDINGGDNTAVLMKEHAIAIAKHFKLTAEDLK